MNADLTTFMSVYKEKTNDFWQTLHIFKIKDLNILQMCILKVIRGFQRKVTARSSLLLPPHQCYHT